MTGGGEQDFANFKLTLERSTGSRKGQLSSWLIKSSSNWSHRENLAVSLGALRPVGFLLRGRTAGDDEREESIDVRTRLRAIILTLPLRPEFGAGEGERDDDREDDDTRRRFVSFFSFFRDRGGGEGEEDTWRFLDRVLLFFVCFLPWRDLLRVCFFSTFLILCSIVFWAARKRI